MRWTLVTPVGAVLALGLPGAAGAQANLGTVLQEIQRLSAAGEHRRSLALADSLAGVLPDHPGVVLRRTLALAAAGRTSDAVRGLGRLLRWDARYARRALDEPALASLRAELTGVDVDSLAARADRPVARGRVWAVLEERDLVPEGTAWDPLTGSVVLGSLNKNAIVAIARDGRVSDRVVRGSHGLGSVAGIHVDPVRRVLWATSNPRFDRPDDTTASAIFAFDLTTGAFRARYPAPGTGPHFLNDLTTGPDGTLYATDSRAGRLWVLRPGAAALEPVLDAGALFSPNGITVSADGRHLFVAAGDRIVVLPLAGGTPWRLDAPDSLDLTGIDGLAFADGALIAHHPLAFWRIARYPLDPDRRAITGRELLESNTPDSRTSTTGEVVHGDYVYIGNGQIDRMNQGTLDSAGMQPVRLYRVPLTPRSTGMVAVALSGQDSVVLFDAMTLERLATVPVGHNPHEIAVSPDGGTGYVANANDTTVTVLHAGPEPRVAATWPLPDSIRVHDVAVSPDGRTVWAASGERSVVLELDAGSGAVRRRFAIDRAGGWMVEPPGPLAALVIANLEGGAVTLLDPASGVQRVFAGSEGEIDAAPTRDGREVWSVNFRDDSLTVFGVRSGRTVGRYLSGREAGRVIFTPDGRTALTVNGGDATVVAFDVATHVRQASVTVAPGPKVIALSRDGRRAYVTHPERGALTLIDVPSLTVLRSVPVPGTPDGVAVIGERS
jgi:DNA-binding beta-propeller fold protein YncE